MNRKKSRIKLFTFFLRPLPYSITVDFIIKLEIDGGMTDTKFANPGALGLVAFGMTTLLVMFYDFTARPTEALAWGMMVFVGGLLQLLVGMMEYRNGNTFGTVAFSAYGAFWMSFAFMNVTRAAGYAGPDAGAQAMYFFVWFLLTLTLFFGTLNTTRTLQAVFGLLAVVFLGLAIGTVLENPDVIKVSAAIGMVLGLVAMYTGLGQAVNEASGKELLPQFPVSK